MTAPAPPAVDVPERARRLDLRIIVNLGFFVVLGVALTAWAATNVLSIKAVRRPYSVSAVFSSSPGLSPGFEVTYLGHKIGTIGSVALAEQSVIVSLDIDRTVRVPQHVDAAVRRLSAIGEPYVDLSPTPGTDASAGPRLAAGDRIPIDHTATPLSYSDLFSAVSQLLRAVPPADAGTLVHELAVGLNGRTDSIRTLIQGADQLTTDLADHSAELASTIDALTQLTATFAAHAGSIGASFDNLAALSSTLQQSEQAIAGILAAGPSFTGDVAHIVSSSSGQLDCLVSALGSVGAALNDPAIAADLKATLARSPELLAILNTIRDVQPDGPYARGYLTLNAGAVPPPFYSPPLPPPAVPPLPACHTAATPNGGAGVPASTAGAGSPVAPTPAANLNQQPPPAVAGPPAAVRSSSESVPTSNTAVVVLAGLLALLVLGATVVTVRRLIPRPSKEEP